MLNKFKVSQESYDLIYKFVDSVTKNYGREELNCLNLLKEQINHLTIEEGNHLIKMIGYLPIASMMYQQFEMLFLSLTDKNITRDKFKKIFFEEIENLFDNMVLNNKILN